MPVNHNLKVIHIPKTGGTSVNQTLFNENELNMKKANKKIFYENYEHIKNYSYELDHSTIHFFKKKLY